jgi:hypothetical protein
MALQEIDCDVISKHMTAKHPTPDEGVIHTSLPLPSYSSKESKSLKNLQIDNTL